MTYNLFGNYSLYLTTIVRAICSMNSEFIDKYSYRNSRNQLALKFFHNSSRNLQSYAPLTKSRLKKWQKRQYYQGMQEPGVAGMTGMVEEEGQGRGCLPPLQILANQKKLEAAAAHRITNSHPIFSDLFIIGCHWHPQFLANQFILFKPGEDQLCPPINYYWYLQIFSHSGYQRTVADSS